MTLVWIASPLLALGVFVLLRRAVGRPLSRHTLNVIVALYLLGYLAATAGLGIFWVARMDLPVFDLHYLFGYCVVLLTGLHLYFQFPALKAFFQRASRSGRPEPARRGGCRPPQGTEPSTSDAEVGRYLQADPRRRRAVAARAWTLLVGIVLGAGAMWLLVEPARPKTAIIVAPGRPTEQRDHPMPTSSNSQPTSEPTAVAEPQHIWIEQSGRRRNAATYLHEESALTRTGILRRARLAGTRPTEFKNYPADGRVALPPAREQAGVTLNEALARRTAGVRRADVTTLSRQELSDLLFHAAGVTDTRQYGTQTLHLRAAPSAGALYPTDVYVLARSVEGVPPGLYYYHAVRHALDRVAGTEAFEKVAAALGPAQAEAIRSAPVTFVLAVVFNRTAWKYDIRSYRYVLMDTGHLAGNLTLAAAALEWPCAFTARFDDERLTEAVGLDPANEGALLVAWLGSAPASASIPAHAAPDLPPDAASQELTRLSHRLTSWRWVEGPPTPRPPGPTLEPGGLTPSEPDASASDLFQLIRSRRSFREFVDREVDQAEFAEVVRDTFRQASSSMDGEFLTLYVVVRKVEGFAAGIYRYEPALHGFQPLARGDFSHRLYDAGLSQELLARAAFVLIWAVDLERVGTLDGERDYRYAGLQAGLAGENAYLSAEARDFGICGVGAFFDADVDELLGLTGTSQRSLYLMAVGRRE